jgi:hypothetical protein
VPLPDPELLLELELVPEPEAPVECGLLLDAEAPLVPELPLIPELLFACEPLVDPASVPMDPDEPALPERPVAPTLPAERDSDPLLVAVSVEVEGPPSDDDPHAANVVISAERTRFGRICMATFCGRLTGCRNFVRLGAEEAGPVGRSGTRWQWHAVAPSRFTDEGRDRFCGE